MYQMRMVLITGIEDLEIGKNILPIRMASVSVIASKMSAEGFNSPSWIILVLSS